MPPSGRQRRRTWRKRGWVKGMEMRNHALVMISFRSSVRVAFEPFACLSRRRTGVASRSPREAPRWRRHSWTRKAQASRKAFRSSHSSGLESPKLLCRPGRRSGIWCRESWVQKTKHHRYRLLQASQERCVAHSALPTQGRVRREGFWRGGGVEPLL